MCGGAISDALNVLDVVTLGAVSATTAGLGLTSAEQAVRSGVGSVMTPKIPGMDNPALPLPVQRDTQERIDEASLQANQRERRRAARRFGRASTIGAGTIGAPRGLIAANKTAIGS